MITALVVLAALSLGAQDDPFETRTYNIEFLTRKIDDHPGRLLGLDTMDSIVEEAVTEPVSFDPNELVELIKSNIDEDSWEHNSAKLEVMEDVLTVTNRRSTHEKISRYLAYWRGHTERHVALDAAFVRIEPAEFARIRGNTDRPVALSAEQLKRILDAAREGRQAEIVKTLRLTAYNGQRVSLQDATQHLYLRDYDAQIATASAMLDPVIDQYVLGAVLDVRPRIEPFSDAVTLEIRATVADLEGVSNRTLKMNMDVGTGAVEEREGKTGVRATPSARSIATESKIQHPKVALESLRTTVTVKAKETILAGASHRNGRMLLFLLTPAIISSEDPVEEPGFQEERLLRLYDISTVTRRLPDFAGPKLDFSPIASAGATPLTGTGFTLGEPEGMRLSGATVAEMLKTRIAPDTWANQRNSILQTPHDTLIVRQKPEVLKEIDAFLKNLLASRAVMITTEAILIGFRKGSKAAWESAIPALQAGGYFVDGAAFAKLLEETTKGANVKVVDRAEITSFPQQRVHVARRQQETYLADYEPQVATLAGAYDPVVSTLETGFVLDVRPHFIGGTERVSIDLRASFVSRELPEMESVSTGIDYLHLPKVTGLRWNANLTCVKDRYTVAVVESRKVGDDVEELVLFVRARANK